MEVDWRQKAVQESGLDLKTVDLIFRGFTNLSSEKEKYIKLLSYRGIVVPGAEKYLSYMYCLRESVLTENAANLEYFLKIGSQEKREKMFPFLYKVLFIYKIVKNNIQFVPRFHVISGNSEPTQIWTVIGVVALTLSDSQTIKTRYLDSISEIDYSTLYGRVLQLRYFSSLFSSEPDYDYGKIPLKDLDSLAALLYLIYPDVFRETLVASISDDNTYSIVLRIAIEFNDLLLFNLLKKANMKGFREVMDETGFNLYNDPVEVFKEMVPFLNTKKIESITFNIIEDHAIKCLGLIQSKIGINLKKDCISWAIKVSNLPAFISLVGKAELGDEHIPFLEDCRAPGIREYFSKRWPKLVPPRIFFA